MPGDGRETLPTVAFRVHDRTKGWLDRAIAKIARVQYGVITLEQLVALGLTPAGVRARVATGRLRHLHRGVYFVGPADVSIRGQWLAAVLACGEDALLCSIDAGALHDLLRPRRGPANVLVARGGGRGHPGIRVHRSLDISDTDRSLVDGIPCTSVTRTLLGIAADAPGLLDIACNQAATRSEVDQDEIEALLARLPGSRGARRLRIAAGLAEPDRSKSALERRFRALCRRAGLPAPAVNEWMAIEGEEMQCDFVWHAPRVVVEVDGWRTHRSKQAFVNDRRRDQLLRLHGWQVVRFTWDDVTKRPSHVVAVVTVMLPR